VSVAQVCAYFDVAVPARGCRMPVEIPDADRGTLADYLASHGATIGAEIGVQAGVYAELLCQRIKGVRLYAVDSWQPYVRHEERVTADQSEALYAEAVGRLARYRVTIMRSDSLAAARSVDDESLDFVYLDSDHEFSAVVADLAAWVPKVKPGGIVAGHDFIKRENPNRLVHVVEAVTGWTQSYRVAPWFVLGRKERRSGERRDSPRSWFWVK
jgi:predicted O-methyltransferase YrrM